jgi:undecaprenyl-diphosphatase
MVHFGEMRKTRLPLVLAIACVLAAPIGAQASSSNGSSPSMSAGGGELLPLEPARSSMSTPQAALLGLVEGLTEFLPVSSTGHLTIVQRLLGLTATPEQTEASDAFAICIQAGAIIAVFLVLFGRIKGMVSGLFGQNKDGLRLLANLVVAFVPAGVIGFFLEDRIKQYLFGVWPVAAAWFVGGIFILLVMNRRGAQEGKALEGLGWQSALLIGLAQVLAMWPGISRSLATIAVGLFVGLSVSAAVEFSFLLGLATLGAATIYEGIHKGPQIIHMFGWTAPVVGLVVAAVAAFAAVRWMIDYLQTRSLAVFGWYRIGAAAVVVALVVGGVLVA